MVSKYHYQVTISNAYLGEVKVIKGETKAEVAQKVAQQEARWREQEARKREQYRLLDLKAQAEKENQNAQNRLLILRELLPAGLKMVRRFDWNQLKNSRTFPPFQFQEIVPTYDLVAQTFEVPPSRPTVEAIFPGLRKKRQDLEAKARNELSRQHAEYSIRKNQAFQNYEEKRRMYETERARNNVSVDEKRKHFEAGDTDAVKWFLKQVLDNLNLPEGYGKDVEIAFDATSSIAVVSMQLPNLVEVPRISGYKYVTSRKAIEPIEMKQKEFEALYDSLICQIALLTIYRCFQETYASVPDVIVYNGWVMGIDRSTGNDFTSCILSIQASRETFQTINLERVEPKECIRKLKGLIAGPLAQLAPVRPIMDLNTFDKRFVESREVLADLRPTDNLAAMDWEDFEHLVRELFSKVFGEYGEVRVTQASRDGGVDAVAFDPDPIRGGKYVIQAKRYNKVVPVSAVRDLYGTMINEGAVKGILVTTSYYGNDSREFVKDKPITLIDGSNLIHMFQQYGYDVRIELQQ